MPSITGAVPSARSIQILARLTFLSGSGGMAISWLFLASSHTQDVVAGAAGFVAGSILAAAGLISISVLNRPGISREIDARGLDRSLPRAPEFGFDIHRWVAHFRRNQEDRMEPAWTAPVTLSADVVAPLVKSLEQFQLGDGGGPASLIAWNADRFRASCGMGTLVDLWFREEREHSRLLGAAVARFGGTCIQRHWSFSAFCLTRKWLGVRFELTVLLLTEIASTVYYRLLRRHGADPALRAMCRLILRDEAGHIQFHRDRLAHAARQTGISYGPFWELTFRTLGLAAATMLWINHAPALKAVGATRRMFYRDTWSELSRFIRRLRGAAPPYKEA